ncbi:Uncharacterised protein [Neisseria meningitidis]|nr:Uncharacterised protein [Neisseria meningitidis]
MKPQTVQIVRSRRQYKYKAAKPQTVQIQGGEAADSTDSTEPIHSVLQKEDQRDTGFC